MPTLIKPLPMRIDSFMTNSRTERVPHGEVAFFSSPSPDHPDRNEDSGVIIADRKWCVLAVSDGAGGTFGGAQAASITIEALEQTLGVRKEPQEVRAAVLDAIESADATIRGTLSGALATIAAFVVDRGTARPISVGDSICAVIGGRGKLKYRSIAHGPTGFAEEAGLLREDEALAHEERHLVSNMLGLPGMRVEVGLPLKLAPRDTVLVASDALFDNVRLEEIAVLSRRRPLASATDALAELARKRMSRGGPLSHADDLTILAFRPSPR